MKKKSSSVLSAVLAAGIALSSALTTSAYSEVSDKNSNIEKQNYIYFDFYAWNWSHPMESFLSAENDSLMRFQPVNDGSGYSVEYYDSNLKLISTVKVPQELPLFGCFYSGSDGYYIVSGQKNPDESSGVEVFRITKYDKSWNRIISDGIFGSNTTIPFDAGSCRVAEYGNYLLIRTSHQMYKTSDGLNHQANVMIQYEKSGTITDYCTELDDSLRGYVSHSFNQFVLIDNDKLVSLDHGDAFPRSLVMTEYPGKVSSGKIGGDYFNPCVETDLITFQGDLGDNYTGATVGGFEYSSSSYLAAGNIESKKTDNSIWGDKNTRNVFVTSVSKTDGSITNNLITVYNEGEESASTPQLVKISPDRFFLLWSTKKTASGLRSFTGKVYYAVLDGEGKVISDIASIDAHLSDCKPVLYNGKLIWYIWRNNALIFYSIDPESMEAKTTVAKGKGDINEDSSVDIADALMIAKYDAGLISLDDIGTAVSDVTGDGSADIADALMVARYDAGLASI